MSSSSLISLDKCSTISAYVRISSFSPSLISIKNRTLLGCFSMSLQCSAIALTILSLNHCPSSSGSLRNVLPMRSLGSNVGSLFVVPSPSLFLFFFWEEVYYSNPEHGFPSGSSKKRALCGLWWYRWRHIHFQDLDRRYKERNLLFQC